jgi:hypothetical protein
MPKVSKQEASETLAMEGFEGRYEKLAGGYTVGFETYTADSDAAPLFQGLPDDRCQCPHWGYVLSGRVDFKFADRDETYEAGDAYVAPPGHTPVFFAGTEIVEFSPSDGLDETVGVVLGNLRAAGVEV